MSNHGSIGQVADRSGLSYRRVVVLGLDRLSITPISTHLAYRDPDRTQQTYETS